jgi:hypothetical protein
VFAVFVDVDRGGGCRVKRWSNGWRHEHLNEG